MATVVSASVVTSLIVGIFIGALLRHFIPQIRKKSLNSSKADVYACSGYNEESNPNEVERSGEQLYAELQICDSQPSKPSAED